MVQAKECERQGIPVKEDGHKLVSVRQSVVAGPEETEDGLQEDVHQSSEANTRDHAKHRDIAQDTGGLGGVLLPKEDGGNRGSAYAQKGAESDDKIHQGEGDGETGYGHGPHSVADENAVDDVVKGSDRHAYDGGDGVLQKQFPDRLGLQ